MFSSSRNDEVSSWFPKARHGVFTYFFLAGLQGYVDSNKDKKITNEEMFTLFIKTKMKRVDKISNFSRKQNPPFSVKMKKYL